MWQANVLPWAIFPALETWVWVTWLWGLGFTVSTLPLDSFKDQRLEEWYSLTRGHSRFKAGFPLENLPV